MSLLIVDDSEQVRQVIKAVVADLTDEVYECGDGSAAVISYGGHRQDWVLMDIEMPGCDGIAATRRIKELFPDARIIILTGHSSPALRQVAEEAGAFAYLLKENLLDLRRLLTRH